MCIDDTCKLVENGLWEVDGQRGMESKFGMFQIELQVQSWLVVYDSKFEFRCKNFFVFAAMILDC